MKTLKVWGGCIQTTKGQCRALIAAYTRKQAIELIAAAGHPMSVYCLDGWWSVTGNKIELETAYEPGVWVCVENNRTYRIKEAYERLI